MPEPGIASRIHRLDDELSRHIQTGRFDRAESKARELVEALEEERRTSADA